MLFLATLSFLSTSLSFTEQTGTFHLRSTEKRHRILASYASSLILSGGIGAITGGTLRYLEKKLKIEACPFALFVTLLGWILESELRNDIIIALHRDLSDYGVAHRQGLMFKGACIASWISYLRA